MRRNKLNRLILLMLAAGILMTAVVNGAVGNARRRRAAAEETEIAANVEPSPAETAPSDAVQYGPGYLPAKADDAAEDAESSAGDAQGIVGPGGNYGPQSPGTYEEFLRKFGETEETIARIRAAEKKNQSDVERQNSASSQLRYWETQMNSVYQTIMSVLSTEEAAVLARDQQDWKKQREQNAAEAARNSAGRRQESTEYTLSQAEATRERAYELLERYRDRL